MNKIIEETKNQIIIPENEILDYLIRKDYIKSNWYNQIASSSIDLKELLEELKESCFDQIHQRYKDYGINYYDLLSIIQALKQLDSGDKTLFGKYNSDRVNKSLSIKANWETNNCWISETIRIYNSCHQFQLRNLKKDQQTINNYIKNIENSNTILEKENQKLINEWKSIISNEDILNKNVKINQNDVELISKNEYLSFYNQYLDVLSNQILDKIRTNEIKEAIQYYKAVENLTKKENIEDNEDNESNNTNVLINLDYLITKGNTSINDYKVFFNISNIKENTVTLSPKSEKDINILYNNSIRNHIFTDIKQLFYFISQKYQELTNYSNTNLIASYILQHSPAIIRKQTSKSLLLLINQLKEIINSFEVFNETWLKAFSKGYQYEILNNLNSKVHLLHYQENKIEKNNQRIQELQKIQYNKNECIKILQSYTDDLKSNATGKVLI
ncbi:hypothetical protein BCR36DRAFT_409228 [Piromyces finnis]|uniref:Uncharacterized protein n=1 Tax=Piromyces finnis TaxID=1754191 RepID=A0A1Y1VJ54_9FUNG|nr:hypothetical protein BCR36DRAFT_409228 [Piromyces finnis]|eukprot:ORX57751.1 hypothetical protein BCR36DRAFT_409228 [Piromyces finnis]